MAQFSGPNHGSQMGRNDGTVNNYFPSQPETPPTPFASIPFLRDPDFVQRGDLLDQIDRVCSESPYRAALVGLGGVGKSQLAIEYGHRISEGEASPWVFWLHGGTHARVEEGLMTIADMLKLPGRKDSKADIPRLVYNWLSQEQNGRWVMVLDSADNPDVFFKANEGGRDGQPLVNYLPQSNCGSILITTRNRDLASRLTGGRQKIVNVGAMTEEEALVLLEKKLGSPDFDKNLASKLVQTLDLVPLAISQAAAYIQSRAPWISLEKYLDEFMKNDRTKARLLSQDSGDLRRDGGASNSILTTWQISFDYIRSSRPTAADLLSLLSFFDPQGIPTWVLKTDVPVKHATPSAVDHLNHANIKDEEPADCDSSTGSDTSDCVADDAGGLFEDDVAMLYDYCLITKNEKGNVLEMHSLVQLTTRKWLEAFSKQDAFKKQYIKRMAVSFPTSDYMNWETCRSLFAHVEKALEYKLSGNTLEELALLLYNGGYYAKSQGMFNIAERMAHVSRRTRRKLMGEYHPATLSSTLLYAHTVANQGRWEEAEKLQVQVMEARKIKLGADHPNTLTSMDNLASTYKNQGRLEEAEQLQLQVMEAYKIKLGADHPDTLTSINNLALTYKNQGRLEEAEQLQLQVMEARKIKLGADHPDTLTSMNNLASTYWNQGQLEEAEQLQLQVMEARKIKLGADHPDTLTSMNNLAFTWRSQGRQDNSLMLMERCAEARRRVIGPSHPDTILSLSALEKWRS